MSQLAQSLDRLINAIEKNHPEWHVTKPPKGLSQDQLRDLRASLDVTPNELLDFLALYDFSCCQLFPFFDQYRPAQYPTRISGIIGLYDTASTTFEDSFVGWTSSTLDSCKLDQCWRESWIPLGWQNANYVFVDMEPSNVGVAGQIVKTNEDGRYLSVIASSLTHMLDRMSEHVKNRGNNDADFRDIFLEPISAHDAG